MKASRQILYDIYKNDYKEEKLLEELKRQTVELSKIVSFYDFWGLMVKKRYLPKWTFQKSSKYTAINTYEKLEPYIKFRREDQPIYASHFEWLIVKLRNR